ncbi:glycosyltransferase family 4 protein [Gemmatimonadota bacterium]
MRLLKIWDAEYPWDVRAEKVMRSLTAGGHEVHLVARNRNGSPVTEKLEEATVHRLAPWPWLGRGFDAASQFPAFMNPRWIKHVHSTAKRQGVEAILVRDLPLAPTAVWVSRRLGVPVILDMAENYPAMIRDIWTSGRQGGLDWIVRNPSLVSRVEKWTVRAVDHVIVVVEESGERLVELGVEPSRVTVVCNTPWPSRIPEAHAPPSPSGEELRFVYLGLLEKPRGLDAVLGGLTELRNEGLSSHLHVIGGGRDTELFKSEADRLGFTDATIRFHGVLPYDQALQIIAEADIGLVPHLAVESWNTTIPNKLFDYMSHGLPVVTSDAEPAARIVREEDCGFVFASDDPGDFAQAVRGLRDPGVRERMGANGRNAVRSKYNWEVDGARLLETLELVRARYVGGRKPSSP